MFLRVHTKIALNKILLASEHRKRHEQLTKSGGHRRYTKRGVHVETEIIQKADRHTPVLWIQVIGYLHILEKVQSVSFLGHFEHIQRTFSYKESVNNDHYAATDHH